MINPFRKYHLAPELKSAQYQRAQSKSAKERRALISIGVIDDSPFEPKNNLETLGYRIALLGDPTNLEAVASHHIILCDLQGVGQSLGADSQGAFLIREIRDTYPEKYVIAYTGGAINQVISRDALRVSDAFLKKDVDIETWVDKLDAVILQLLDPYQVWQRQRRALVNKEVDTQTILIIEDAFVRSIAAKSGGQHSAFAKLLTSARIGQDVRAIVQSLIASGLFKLLVG